MSAIKTPAELKPIITADTLPVVASDPIPLKTKAGERACYFIDLQACTPAIRTTLLDFYHGRRRELLEKTTTYLLNQSLPIIVSEGESDDLR